MSPEIYMTHRPEFIVNTTISSKLGPWQFNDSRPITEEFNQGVAAIGSVVVDVTRRKVKVIPAQTVLEHKLNFSFTDPDTGILHDIDFILDCLGRIIDEEQPDNDTPFKPRTELLGHPPIFDFAGLSLLHLRLDNKYGSIELDIQSQG